MTGQVATDILPYLGLVIGIVAAVTLSEAILGLRAKSRFRQELVAQAMSNTVLKSLMVKAERKELTDADIMLCLAVLRRNLISLPAFDRQLVEMGLNQHSRVGRKNYVTDILTTV